MPDKLDVEFQSGGETCRAWFFRADRDSAPCVVMGHGFGGTRECGLEPYAKRFAEAGFHALVFDYRHFGASDGEPRQLLDVGKQLEDWAAALSKARHLEGVDPNRVVAWGTSFAGGHVLVAGVRDGRVAGIISQCPMMDGMAAFNRAIKYAGFVPVLKIAGHALLDLACAAAGRDAHRVPIVGDPGELAMMSTPDARPGYEALVPPHVRADVAARIALSLSFYRPVNEAHKLRCPLLLLVCDHDSVAPIEPALEAARRGGHHVELHRFPIGHFDIYQGEHFERAAAAMLAFLARVVPEEP